MTSAHQVSRWFCNFLSQTGRGRWHSQQLLPQAPADPSGYVKRTHAAATISLPKQKPAPLTNGVTGLLLPQTPQTTAAAALTNLLTLRGNGGIVGEAGALSRSELWGTVPQLRPALQVSRAESRQANHTKAGPQEHILPSDTSTSEPGADLGWHGAVAAQQMIDTDALPLDSVVKIFTVATSPSYFLPWQNKPQREITGSGFILEGRRILTNAHVVADQTFVMVRKHGSPTKFPAVVRAVGHECDLALLEVSDEEFWEGIAALELGEVPQLQEAVAVVGYPQGGDNISVTGGVVSRVEPTQYVHGASLLMAIQIDAAINPGNSGGPALMGSRVAGVAFQNLAQAESIGYIIPVPIVRRFLDDVDSRGASAFCTLGVTCQAMENPQLRASLGMHGSMSGVLVNRVHPLTHANEVLKKDDVLLAFDGTTIANDGTVHFRKRERISFDHLVSMKRVGDMARLTILREKAELEVDLRLEQLKPLVPIHEFDRLPSYYIFAGLVFVPLTQPYLHEYGDDWYNSSPRRLCQRALTAALEKENEQLVIISQVLVDELNAGYERLSELQVKQVNKEEVRNLEHLRSLIENCTEEYLRLDLEDERVIVFHYKTAMQKREAILERHRIHAPMSLDLKAG